MFANMVSLLEYRINIVSLLQFEKNTCTNNFHVGNAYYHTERFSLLNARQVTLLLSHSLGKDRLSCIGVQINGCQRAVLRPASHCMVSE